MAPGDAAVLELSSFQLMTMQDSPHIAVLTNLAPNHLDVHRDMAEYVAAKENIFTHQSPQDIAIFNADNAVTAALSEKAPGTVRLFSRQREEPADGRFPPGRDKSSPAGTGRGAGPILRTSRTSACPASHNVENYLAAIAAVDGLVDDRLIRDFAREFGGVEHRIELVRTRRGVRWYNDSIASSPSRTIAGLNSFREKVILIAGGKDKGISYAPLGPVVNEHVKLLILCGATAGVIRQAVTEAENYAGLEIRDCGGLPRCRGSGGQSGRGGRRGDPLACQHVLRPLCELHGTGERVQGPGSGAALREEWLFPGNTDNLPAHRMP
jgi:UDP-N-acetylmuramoylalanine--D-glutamate ligase